MIKALREFVDNQLLALKDEYDEGRQQTGCQYAAAMLLLEMCRADHKIEPVEHDAVAAALAQAFSLSDADIKALVDLAEAEIDHTTCLYEFTRTLNDQLPIEKKQLIVEMLWRVAYADGELDKYEDYFVRKIAELLHVRHGPMIQAKHRAGAD